MRIGARGLRARRTFLRRSGGVTAWGVVGAVTLTLLQAPAVGAADGVDEAAREKRRPKTAVMDSVDVTPLAWEKDGEKDAAAQAARVPYPKTVWPAAGKGVAELPVEGLRAQARAGSLTAAEAAVEDRAGTLPVRIVTPAAVRGKLASRNAAAREAGVEALGTQVPGRVDVEVMSRAKTERTGVDGLLLTVARADGETAAGRVTVEIDYKAFAAAYGGDWASRLRVVQHSPCLVTSATPGACADGKVLRTSNDRKNGTLTAEVALPEGTAGAKAPTGAAARSAAAATTASAAAAGLSVLSVSAGAAGSSGNYAATSLTPSGTWSVAGNSGSFTWQYPMRVPPSIAGPSPQLSLSYSSGSVDGRTASTNSQTSWVGEGFDLSQGYIERSYRSCKDDGHDTEGEEKYDLCWHSDNATMSFGGRNGELVKKSGADASRTLDGNPDMKLEGTWRLKTDDGTRVERWSGGFNTGDSKEFWVVTTTDGTRYYFGRNKRSAADGESQESAWQVPVYGDDSGEPCHESTFKDSRCDQTWRWNLDYVVDVHGNSMTLYWEKETNRYGAMRDDVSVAYDRGGHLKRIEYGEREGSDLTTDAPARVVFGVAERCDGAAADCEPGDLKEDTATRWPDVPFDQICTDTDSCKEQWSPAFFSRKRLTSVTTQILKSGSYTPVDTWTLDQSYPATADTSPRSLWLQSITHVGKANGGTSESLKTVFWGVKNTNRVHAEAQDRDPMYKWRIRAIRSESGGEVAVTYKPVECTVSDLPTPHTNTKRCFPSFWSKEGAIGEDEDWFHKYVIDTVIEDDRTVAGLNKTTKYEYYGGAAWRYDDSELAKSKNKTWSQFRGFQTVRTVTGDAGTAQLSSEATYLRGMDGDRTNGDGGTEDVWVTASDGTRIEDKDRLQGYQLEARTYSSVPAATAADRAAKEINGSVNTPWISAPTATEGSDNATLVGTDRIDTRTAVTGGIRRTAIDHTYDSYGMISSSSDLGDVGEDKANGNTADDSCTRYEYARNTDKTLLTLVKRVHTVAVDCATTPSYPGDAISDVRTLYDDLAYGAVPTKGDVSSSQRVTGYSGTTPVLQTTTSSDYDVHGRVTAVQDARNNRTTTSYTPATGGPVTGMKVTTPPAVTGGTGQTTSSSVDPAWGLVTATTDANNQRTDLAYDALGRLVKVWLPGRAKATDIPNTEYAYDINADAATVVTTRTLKPNGNVSVSHQLYDGLLRARQTQTPTPNTGRVLNLVEYDSRGLAVVQHGPFYNLDDPGTTVVEPQFAVGGNPPATETVYDGAGRATASVFKVGGAEKWRTRTVFHGDCTDSDPPTGGTPTRVCTDAQGRRVSLTEYESDSVSGTGLTTTYAYDKAGRLSSVKDPTAKNEWKWTYDALGRQRTADDPDKGLSTMAYDELDRLTTATDPLGVAVTYHYDNLGRTTKITKGGETLNSWVYDTLPNGIGRVTSASTFSGGNEYKSAVNSYDVNGHPTSTAVVIPAAEGRLAGTYTTTATYKADGSVSGVTVPAAGPLPSEKITTGYDLTGLPVFTYGTTDYVRETRYSNFGETEQLTLGVSSAAKQTWLTNFHEDGTRRLTGSRIDRESIANPDVDATYVYDAAGNIKTIADAPAGKTADVQCFQYDYLRRLKTAWSQTSATCEAPPAANSVIGGPAPYWHSYEYDTAGNRTKEIRNPVNPAAGGASALRVTTTAAMPAAGADRPHALPTAAVATETVNSAGTVTARTDTTQSHAYDAAGKTVRRTKAATALSPAVDQLLRWDAVGRLAGTSKAGEKGTVTGNGGLCLDLKGGATASGTVIQGLTCASGSTAQAWELNKDEQLAALGVCAVPNGTTSGSAILARPCSSTDATQKWKIQDNGTVKHTATGLCLTLTATTSGTAATAVTCSTSATQRWSFAKHTTNVYGSDGNRLIRKEYGKATLYLGTTELTVDTKNTAATTDDTTSAVRYYRHGGRTVAVRSSTTQVHWLAGGLNGTAELVIDAVGAGQTVTQRRTLPFGEVRGANPSTWPGQQGFVGAVNDPGSGLVHMGARQYDPALGRFLSVDPVLDLSDPQHLNPYAYGRNNPVMFPDPTGLWWGWSDWGHAALDVVGLVPVVGEAADIANGIWYTAEGNYVDAGLSFSSAIPIVGYGASAAKGAKYVDEGIEAVQAVTKTTDKAADAKGAANAADNVTPPATPKPKEAPKPDPPAKPKDDAGSGSGTKGDGAGGKKDGDGGGGGGDEGETLFRGTTKNYGGGAGTKTSGSTPSSWHPGVATAYAVHSASRGSDAVVHVIPSSNLQRAGIETERYWGSLPQDREVVINALPGDVANAASLSIPVDRAREILSGIGIDIPAHLPDPKSLDEFLKLDLPDMTPGQISDFVQQASR
ncbi:MULTISPECIES: ricin-type beta-trefoil lectin domain protein [Streptomyces]|uniref:ricin-type beta-trefoil lectin domain protein n=1 Tax=Streptomyces TaxID=1883 RepID=UPI000ACB098B|nr:MULTISPECIES: ricin-type beta-trefoil lectin domain protein [Streptomyces]